MARGVIVPLIFVKSHGMLLKTRTLVFFVCTVTQGTRSFQLHYKKNGKLTGPFAVTSSRGLSVTFCIHEKWLLRSTLTVSKAVPSAKTFPEKTWQSLALR